jgi:hypothetical protein
LSTSFPAAAPAEAIPLGILSDAATPSAYRLDLTIIPENERFSGHAEIDVTLRDTTSSLFMHGRDLKVGSAIAKAGGRTIKATYTQVEETGVVRLDFASPATRRPLPCR